MHVLVETDTLRVFTRTSNSKNQFLQSLPYFGFLLIIILLKFRAGFLGCFSFVLFVCPFVSRRLKCWKTENAGVSDRGVYDAIDH